MKNSAFSPLYLFFGNFHLHTVGAVLKVQGPFRTAFETAKRFWVPLLENGFTIHRQFNWCPG